uniref:Immunoglobulin V-set domain-containing protein n=1 Tax=Sus scrofa TaxID=9823 RepID=A0A8D1CTV6_PIG
MKNGSLQISNLRREDEGSYFCQVEMITEKYGEQKWQSIQGTELTITHAAKTATPGPTTSASTAATTAADLWDLEGKRSSGSWLLNKEAVVRLALPSAVLKIAILGLMVFLRWKRSKGLQTKARTPARRSQSPPQGEPAPGGCELCPAQPLTHHPPSCSHAEEHSRTRRGNTRALGTKSNRQTPRSVIREAAQTWPEILRGSLEKNDGILYAPLTLHNLPSPAAPPCPPAHGGPQEETLFSALKT